jgi:hypothetical protein
VKVVKVCGRQGRAVPAISPASIAGSALTRHDSGSRQVLYTSSLRVEVLRMQSCLN